MASKRSRGRGRGVLALTSFDPLPRPSPAILEIKPQTALSQQQKPVNVVKPLAVEKIISNVNDSIKKNKEGEVKLMAKYKYKANPAMPGGFPELTIVQGENLILVDKGHAPTKNPLWWEVRNQNGEQGYVPGNYCYVLEDKLTSLPWLENKRLDEERERKEAEKKAKNTPGGFPVPSKPIVKQYVSAYDTSSNQNADEQARKYYCKICDKNLNGPQPYKMHIASRNHREEEERLKQM